MKLLDFLERKIGRFAIKNLMLYIVLTTAAVYVVCLVSPEFILNIILIPDMVAKGEVWRLISFLFFPSSISSSSFFFVALSLYFYYFIGKMLERRWGAFRFNVYYFIGTLCTIIASMTTGFYAENYFLNESLFLAFSVLYPDVSVLLFFIVPIKVWYLGVGSGALLIYQFIVGSAADRVMIIASLINFFLFFGPKLIRNMIRFFKEKKWKNFRQAFRYNSRPNRSSFTQYHPGNTQRTASGTFGQNGQPGATGPKVVHVPFHRCCICGKTELDDPNMEFRYCSECGIPSEYCRDHLYNHTHRN